MCKTIMYCNDVGISGAVGVLVGCVSVCWGMSGGVSVLWCVSVFAGVCQGVSVSCGVSVFAVVCQGVSVCCGVFQCLLEYVRGCQCLVGCVRRGLIMRACITSSGGCVLTVQV